MRAPPKIVYITAGAAGMYCGSCIRDNRLIAGLEKLGWDTLLLPLYTPIRVDGNDHSLDKVFFGGVNVFLQQKIPLFRHLPGFLDRWLDNPALIRRVASGSVSVSAKELGGMTLSMVKGEHGFQAKEVGRLVHWLEHHAKPDLICLTNLLVGGSIPALKRELGVPIYVTLQGDDVFLEELEEPWRSEVLAEMKTLAAEADGFLTFSEVYRQKMGDLLDIPAEKFHLTPLGIAVEEFDDILENRDDREPGQVIGYFARLAPEKGFDLAVDAFIELALENPEVTFRAGGWLSEKDRDFQREQLRKISVAGLDDRFECVEDVDDRGKADFFRGIDVFTVPARFMEPKGLYVLEAMACGIPVVAPDRGVFPEMIEAGGGGLLCEPENSSDLAAKISELLRNSAKAVELGEAGRSWVAVYGDEKAMAKATATIYAEALRMDQQG